MSDITAQLARLKEGIVFPGRLRIFASDSWAGLIPAGEEREWQHAGPEVRLAAACGAAWAEARRGGRVAVVNGPALSDPCGAEARELVGHLGFSNLHELAAKPPPAGDDDDEWPVFRQEWQPVRLASLPMGGLPPWPVDGDGRAMETWLGAREPRLFLAHAQPGWSTAAPGPALCLALGQLATEGLRVVWRVPVGVRLDDCGAALADLGRRGLGLKLIVTEPPSAALLASLTNWWVWSPADAGELAAVLANVLDHEEPTLVVLPDASADVAPWPATQAVVAGDGRELLAGGTLTVVADGHRAGLALRLARAMRHAGAFACTSRHPLPVAHLVALAARGSLAVIGENLALAITAALAPSGGGRVITLSADGDLVSLVERLRLSQ